MKPIISALTYFVRYEWRDGHAGKWTAREWHALATSPVQALNHYHEEMQRMAERNGYRDIIRPKLRPEHYRIVEFSREGLAPYDLPATANPDLAKRKDAPPVNTEFGFVPDVVAQGNPDREL